MHVSLNTLGCEENILAEVLCASSTHELEIAVKYYEAVLKKPLKDKIISKTTNGSPFQKLLVAILSNKRASHFAAKQSEADGKAELLYNAGLSDKSIARDDDTIFTFLSKESRESCQMISASYENIYKLDLVEAILSKYRGPVAFGLMLWTADLNDAIVKRFQVNITDPHVKVVGLDLRHLSHLFAKYNHRKLTALLENYKELFEVDLLDLVKEKFSGNYRKAVLGWLANNTCDGGKEEHIAEILDSFESLDDMLKDTEKTALVEKLLKEQNEILKAYSVAHHIHTESVKKTGKPITYVNALDKKQSDYNKNFAIMKEYLKERFTIEDEDDSGYLDSNEFNHVMKNMNIGFTDEEIKNIMEWIDADGNGELSYDECLVELSDCCINAILNRCNGKSVPQVIDELNVKHQTDYDTFAAEYQPDTTMDAPSSDLTPSLEGYLKDVFMAADVDNSGQLDPTEFFNVLHTVFNMTDGDKEFLSSNWDDNGDGLISWAEALDEFSKIFTRLRDTRSDYWIALLDKPTGRFFWFNVRDEHSFWMNAEDEANYQRLISEGLERTEPIKPQNIPEKVPSKSAKLTAREIRVLQKKKAKQARLDKQKSSAVL